MRKYSRILMALVACICMVSMIGVNVQASSSFEAYGLGSIIVDYEYDGEVLAGVDFKAYHVAETEDNSEYEMAEGFEDFEIDFPSLSYDEYWISIRNNLQNYVNLNMVEPTVEFTTDENGSYKLDDLEAGLYYISAGNFVADGTAYYSDPILIMVGYFMEEIWMYHYEAAPKVDVLPYEADQGLEVEKVWENISDDSQITDYIEVELYCNGELYDTVTLSRENDWSYEWEGIDQTATWAILETTTLEEYEVEYDYTYFKFIITNTYTGPEVDNYEYDESLPQTGTNAKSIPIYAGIGVGLIIVGAMVSKKGKNNEF